MLCAVATPTRLDALRRRFLHGELELDAFEAEVAELRASGQQHDPEPRMSRVLKACTVCGTPSEESRCPRHRRPKNRTRNPQRDLAAQQRFARAVKRRDGYRCVQCGSTEDLRAAHTRPLHRGGGYDPAEGITLCGDCDRATDPYAR